MPKIAPYIFGHGPHRKRPLVFHTHTHTHIHQSPTFSFEFEPIPRPYPSAATYAHPCPPMLFKLRPCIQKLCNVHYPPTPSLDRIGQIKGRSLVVGFSLGRFLVSVFPASKILTLIWSWMQRCRDAQNQCPPMYNNIAPMPTQNPWVWVGMGMGMGTQCRALTHTHTMLVNMGSQVLSPKLLEINMCNLSR